MGWEQHAMANKGCKTPTIDHGFGLGALQPQRGPEAGSVIEAPALLDFGWAALSGDVSTW